MGSAKVLKRLGTLAGVALFGIIFLPDISLAQKATATTHTIFMTAFEVKGSTTSDKLAPPSVNPGDLSKGYEFKPPGKADKSNPKKWQVSSYRFSPGFVVVRQGNVVKLTVFVVNGDEHEVRITDPDGREIVAMRKWNRGREYKVSFVANKPGSYQMACSTHAPTMQATFLVLPK